MCIVFLSCPLPTGVQCSGARSPWPAGVMKAGCRSLKDRVVGEFVSLAISCSFLFKFFKGLVKVLGFFIMYVNCS